MRFIAITSLLFSVGALACPNLAGKYAACRSTTGASSGATDMVISQSVKNNITTYNISSVNSDSQSRETEIYKADGKVVTQEITDPDTGITLKTSSVVKCAGDALSIRYDLLLMGEAAGFADVKITKSGSQIVMETKGNNGDEDYSDKVICE